jgi:hypothetical protein
VHIFSSAKDCAFIFIHLRLKFSVECGGGFGGGQSLQLSFREWRAVELPGAAWPPPF